MPDASTPVPEADPAIAAVVLAAGESRRMGAPKLLLRHRGRSLLAGAVVRAGAVAGHVVVVVGAYPEPYRSEAEAAGAIVVENPRWSAGMGGSIRAGIGALPEGTRAALIVLPDQPFVAEAHLRALLARWREGADMVFSRYPDSGALGVPALLDAGHFAGIPSLPDDCGARALLPRAEAPDEVPLTPEATRDVDTPEDAAALLDAPSPEDTAAE